MKKYPILFLLAFIAFTLNIYAQNGQSDVRIVTDRLGFCFDNPVDFIIEVKAAAPGSEFFMSEQNYRFSFNRNALANPRIVEELTISGFIPANELPQPRELGFTLFSPHNLIGSLDTVVSYNVELAGGDGYYLTADEWVQVGRIEFDVVNTDACHDLVWHPQAIFPPTFVGEVFTLPDGTDGRSNTDENFYGDNSGCIFNLCVDVIPVELVDFTGEERNCENHLTWQTATETNSNYFVIERSLDAIQFSEIGRVTAAGNSQQHITYDFVDSSAGTIMYYRLKQVDTDGSYEYFDIIKIDSDCYADDETPIDVFPNPTIAHREAFIKLFSKTSQTVFVDILNVAGVLVSQIETSISDGPNLLLTSLKCVVMVGLLLQVNLSIWVDR